VREFIHFQEQVAHVEKKEKKKFFNWEELGEEAQEKAETGELGLS